MSTGDPVSDPGCADSWEWTPSESACLHEELSQSGRRLEDEMDALDNNITCASDEWPITSKAPRIESRKRTMSEMSSESTSSSLAVQRFENLQRMDVERYERRKQQEEELFELRKKLERKRLEHNEALFKIKMKTLRCKLRTAAAEVKKISGS